MGELVKEIQDYRHLEWSRIRHSSGTAGSFLKAQEILCGVKKYYKLSNCDFAEGIIGHECVNEFVVDRLLSLMGIPHLSYDLVHALVVVDGLDGIVTTKWMNTVYTMIVERAKVYEGLRTSK